MGIDCDEAEQSSSFRILTGGEDLGSYFNIRNAFQGCFSLVQANLSPVQSVHHRHNPFIPLAVTERWTTLALTLAAATVSITARAQFPAHRYQHPHLAASTGYNFLNPQASVDREINRACGVPVDLGHRSIESRGDFLIGEQALLHLLSCSLTFDRAAAPSRAEQSVFANVKVDTSYSIPRDTARSAPQHHMVACPPPLPEREQRCRQIERGDYDPRSAVGVPVIDDSYFSAKHREMTWYNDNCRSNRTAAAPVHTGPSHGPLPSSAAIGPTPIDNKFNLDAFFKDFRAGPPGK